MSEYRRLISYLYAYDAGVKTINVGFAKAELRNGRLKLIVDVKNVMFGQNKADINFFYRKNSEDAIKKEYNKIRIGELNLNNGQGQMQTRIDESELASHGIIFENIAGILITENDNIDYAIISSWGEENINPYELVKKTDIYRENYNGKETGKETGKEEFYKENYNEKETRKEDIYKENYNEKQSGKEDFYKENYNEKQNEKEEFYREKYNEKEKEETYRENYNEREISKIMETPLKIEKLQKPDELKQSLIVENSNQKDTLKPETNQETKLNTDSISYINNSNCNMEVTSDKDIDRLQSDKETTDDESIYEAAVIKENNMFSDSAVYELKKIKPDELMETVLGDMSQMEAMSLKQDAKTGDISIVNKIDHIVNNSFLMHGYYNYDHIIVGKKYDNDKDKELILIGVPGIFHEKEQFMASMFGFPQFEKIDNDSSKEEYNGYWYTYLET